MMTTGIADVPFVLGGGPNQSIIKVLPATQYAVFSDRLKDKKSFPTTLRELVNWLRADGIGEGETASLFCDLIILVITHERYLRKYGKQGDPFVEQQFSAINSFWIIVQTVSKNALLEEQQQIIKDWVEEFRAWRTGAKNQDSVAHGVSANEMHMEIGVNRSPRKRRFEVIAPEPITVASKESQTADETLSDDRICQQSDTMNDLSEIKSELLATKKRCDKLEAEKKLLGRACNIDKMLMKDKDKKIENLEKLIGSLNEILKKQAKEIGDLKQDVLYANTLSQVTYGLYSTDEIERNKDDNRQKEKVDVAQQETIKEASSSLTQQLATEVRSVYPRIESKLLVQEAESNSLKAEITLLKTTIIGGNRNFMLNQLLETQDSAVIINQMSQRLAESKRKNQNAENTMDVTKLIAGVISRFLCTHPNASLEEVIAHCHSFWPDLDTEKIKESMVFVAPQL